MTIIRVVSFKQRYKGICKIIEQKEKEFLELRKKQRADHAALKAAVDENEHIDAEK
jgi:hypothetical protein